MKKKSWNFIKKGNVRRKGEKNENQRGRKEKKGEKVTLKPLIIWLERKRRWEIGYILKFENDNF